MIQEQIAFEHPEHLVTIQLTYPRMAQGTRLYVFPFNEYRRRPVREGYATYLGDVSIGQRFGFTKPQLMHSRTPMFRMQSGEIVYGIECAWTDALLKQDDCLFVMQTTVKDKDLELCRKKGLLR